MSIGTMRKAVRLAKKTGYVFVITSDAEGIPHMTVISELVLGSLYNLVLTTGHCPRTEGNLWVNPRLTLVVWDEYQDKGFQIVGKLEGKEVDPEPESTQTNLSFSSEKKIIIRVEKVSKFSYGPHDDQEERLTQEKRNHKGLAPVVDYFDKQNLAWPPYARRHNLPKNRRIKSEKNLVKLTAVV